MTHRFFNQASTDQSAAIGRASRKPKTYSLSIKPNAVSASFDAEIQEDGTILAIKYFIGVAVRRNALYDVVQTPTSLWFRDRWGGMHPID